VIENEFYLLLYSTALRTRLISPLDIVHQNTHGLSSNIFIDTVKCSLNVNK